MEIDSITVPQDLIEDELEPTLLLFVNSESPKYKLSKNDQLSSSTNNDCTSINNTPSNKVSESEIAQRKAVTKALRSIKKKSYPLVNKTSELCASSLNQEASKIECVTTTNKWEHFTDANQSSCSR